MPAKSIERPRWAPSERLGLALPALALLWRRTPKEGRYASVSDIPRAEKIDRTYAGDIQRLTLLAPEAVEAIVEGRQPAEMTLPVLMKPFAVEWVGQSAEACGKSEDSHPAPTGTQNKMPTFVPIKQYKIE